MSSSGELLMGTALPEPARSGTGRSLGLVVYSRPCTASCVLQAAGYWSSWAREVERSRYALACSRSRRPLSSAVWTASAPASQRSGGCS
jgi:hypothetical protein